MDRRKLQAIVAYIAQSASAAGLLLWGVVNMAVLATQYLRRTGDEENWLVSLLLCLVFGLLPFCVGAWLLFRLVVSNSGTRKTNASEGEDR